MHRLFRLWAVLKILRLLQDLAIWSQCTYSAKCAGIASYPSRVECSDDCLTSHKAEVRRKAELQRRHEEMRRRKEAEALLQANDAHSTQLSMLALAIVTTTSLVMALQI